MSKRVILISILLFSYFTFITAIEGTIVFIEGEVDYKSSTGQLEWADFGMKVRAGDTIITGEAGRCEIELENGSTINLASDTAFTFSQQDLGGSVQTVFSCSYGEIAYKFFKFTGKEPAIQSPGTTCGLRGTAFTVLVGADGSTLYVVSEGEVAVTSQSVEVLLGLDEGVEVEVGETPGVIFPVLIGEEDYSDWRAEAEVKAFSDPIATMLKFTQQLREYNAEMLKYKELHEELLIKVEEERDVVASLNANGENDAAQNYMDEVVKPLQNNLVALVLNYRFYALSSMSLRRHVVANLFVKVRGEYFSDSSNPLYISFRAAYDDFIEIYETETVLRLVPADI